MQRCVFIHLAFWRLLNAIVIVVDSVKKDFIPMALKYIINLRIVAKYGRLYIAY